MVPTNVLRQMGGDRGACTKGVNEGRERGACTRACTRGVYAR